MTLEEAGEILNYFDQWEDRHLEQLPKAVIALYRVAMILQLESMLASTMPPDRDGGSNGNSNGRPSPFARAASTNQVNQCPACGSERQGFFVETGKC